MQEAISLKEYNRLLGAAIKSEPQLQGRWITAETADVGARRGGHCYLELVQKHPDSGVLEARLSAVIWASVYQRIAAEFKAVTGQDFTTGMKVMVRVSANFHEAYGFKAIIDAINPEFTLGDMVKRRQEIIKRLTDEGIIELNRRLPWPAVPQRVAVISAASAAGYGDFMRQLADNPRGVRFYTALFTASMQGTNTSESVRAALQRVAVAREHFDTVVIIRGGGSSSDLNWFDDYDLAAAVARFPLPVIIGIGHERDVTVLDWVAAMRVKTPTAAAQWLITRGNEALDRLASLATAMNTAVTDALGGAREHLAYCATAIRGSAGHLIAAATQRVGALAAAVVPAATSRVAAARQRLDASAAMITSVVTQQLAMERVKLDGLAERTVILSPRNVINRGFAVARDTRQHFVSSVTQVNAGDTVYVHLSDGCLTTQVTTKQRK